PHPPDLHSFPTRRSSDLAVKKLKVGNGLDAGVQVGPLISQDGLEKVKVHVKDAIDRGAKLLTGGKAKQGLFYQPTVLANVAASRSEEHTSELQSRENLVC